MIAIAMIADSVTNASDDGEWWSFLLVKWWWLASGSRLESLFLRTSKRGLTMWPLAFMTLTNLPQRRAPRVRVGLHRRGNRGALGIELQQCRRRLLLVADLAIVVGIRLLDQIVDLRVVNRIHALPVAELLHCLPELFGTDKAAPVLVEEVEGPA